MIAFLILVSISAIGSTILIGAPLPTRFYDPGHLSLERAQPEAYSAHLKLPQKPPRPSANSASIPRSHFELRSFLRFLDHRFSRHLILRQTLKGMPISLRSSKPSSSDGAVVVMVIFMPLTLSILSYSISGKRVCSLRPNV